MNDTCTRPDTTRHDSGGLRRRLTRLGLGVVLSGAALVAPVVDTAALAKGGPDDCAPFDMDNFSASASHDGGTNIRLELNYDNSGEKLDVCRQQVYYWVHSGDGVLGFWDWAWSDRIAHATSLGVPYVTHPVWSSCSWVVEIVLWELEGDPTVVLENPGMCPSDWGLEFRPEPHPELPPLGPTLPTIPALFAPRWTM